MRKSLVVISSLLVLGAGCVAEKPPTTLDEIKNVNLTIEGPEKKTPMDVFSTTEEASEKASGEISALPGVLDEKDRLGKTAVIRTAKGEIVFDILGDEAPLAASNFIWLARQKFFNTLTFHRVEPGFVIQGGDPKGDGTGGPGYTFADEPVRRPYVAGTVAMANAGPNTNGSQFFIMLEDSRTLPPNYTIFGIVKNGMDVVRSIAPGDRMETVTILDSR